MGVAPQECSEPGCAQPTAFKTRTRAAWCDEHITAIFRAGGLEPLEPFMGPRAWRLTRCLHCGCEAHYRLEYVVDRNSVGLSTCQACHWRDWAADTRRLQGVHARLDVITEAVARAHADEHGHDYLGALTSPPLPDDPHRYRCRTCGRISAARMGDIAFGCACLTHAKRSLVSTKEPGTKQRELLKDTGLPVLTWWDHQQNPPKLWATATPRSRTVAHWHCPTCDLRFSAFISDMARFAECPDCERRHRDEQERLRITPIADVPELMLAWDDEADPRTSFVYALGTRHWFRCARGHRTRPMAYHYLLMGCWTCHDEAHAADPLPTDGMVISPRQINPEIAAQWHPTRNGTVNVATLSPGSRRTFWWREDFCGHEWQDTPSRRDSGTRLRCPVCGTILDSLAYHFPDIAAEWSLANPVTAWHVRPSAQTRFLPRWVCATDPEHSWQAPLSSRVNGSGCPQCREHGKSAVELEHFAVAQRLFEQARSGEVVRSEAFIRRRQWSVDITADLAGGQQVAIEYDGAYWHADKAEVDTEKSTDLLAAGYLVARLREHPLPPLTLTHERYREFVVYSHAPDPEDVITRVRYWAGATSRR